MWSVEGGCVVEDVECRGRMWRKDVEGGCGVWRNEMKGT